jgi:transposase
MAGLASEAAVPKTVMIDATDLKAHRRATCLWLNKGGDDKRRRLIGRMKGGLNTKLHAVTDAEGRPIRFFMTAGQVSDYTGAAALLSSLSKAEWLLADRGCDADWFRDALKGRGIKPCIPGRKSRAKPIKHDRRRDKRRSRVPYKSPHGPHRSLQIQQEGGVGTALTVNLTYPGDEQARARGVVN